MRSDNFNEEAMEKKISKNSSFTKRQIHQLLREELRDVVKRMKISEVRAVELSDQIDYMNEKYPILEEEKNEENPT